MKLMKVRVRNLKLIKSIEGEMPSGGVVLVKGDNERGKSSFLQGLLALVTAGSNNNMLSHGKPNGYIEGDFLAANGEVYTVRMDLDPKSGSNRFTIRDSKGNVRKTVTDVKDFFGYNTVTMEDFIDYGKTVEGARKQASIVMQLLPDEVQEEYRRLEEDEKVSYDNRTFVGRKLDEVRKTLRNQTPDQEDLDAADSYKVYSAEHDVVRGSIAAYDGVITLEEEITRKEDLKNAKESHLNDLRSQFKGCGEEIKRLERLIEEQKVRMKEIKSRADGYLKEVDSIRGEEETLRSQREETLKGLNEKYPTGREGLEKRLEELEALLTESDHARIRIRTHNEMVEEFKGLEGEHKKEDDRVHSIRQAKRNLLTTELPIEGLFIEDGMLYVEKEGNLHRFNTNECSQSEVMVKTLEVLRSINPKLKMMLISRGNDFGPERMKALHEMAKENEELYLIEYVTGDNDLLLEGYEEGGNDD